MATPAFPRGNKMSGYFAFRVFSGTFGHFIPGETIQFSCVISLANFNLHRRRFVLTIFEFRVMTKVM